MWRLAADYRRRMFCDKTLAHNRAFSYGTRTTDNGLTTDGPTNVDTNVLLALSLETSTETDTQEHV